MKSTNQKGFSALDIVLGVALVAVIGVAGYFAYQNSQNKPSSSATPSPSTSPTPVPSAGAIPDGWAKFTHPKAGYSLYYPKDWKGGLGPVGGAERAPKELEDFYIETQGHKVVTQGVPELEQGAEMYVTVEKTTKSLDDIYNSNQIGAAVNRNKTATKVAGQPAIQYDYAYEQIRAVTTMFTSDGIVYRVTLRYVDDKGRQTYWNDYTQLLGSFKLN